MRRPLALAALAALWLQMRPAAAWDAGTTHAGLTEKAALASSLKRRLGPLFGLPLGLFEALRLEARDPRTRELRARLSRIDAASGAQPDSGRLPALSWLVAGSIVEEIPPIRRRNHFFDPVSGRGLHQGGPVAGVGFGLAAVGSGVASVADLFVGDAFDGTGAASTAWITSPGNDLSLQRFLDARERAVAAAAPADRESALAEALLTAGALLHVIEDAAVPAYVHNDFKVDLYDAGGPLLTMVAALYGRTAVPPPGGPARPVAHLAELIHTGDGSGLADRTARRFYSLGLLVGDFATKPKELPALRPGENARGYAFDADHRRLARYRRVGGRVIWDLDELCYADQAAALLPDAGQAALSAIEHLFRGPLNVVGGAVNNGPLALGAGRVVVLIEDERGVRRPVSQREVSGVAAGELLAELPSDAASKRVAILFRGVDAAGEPIVTSVEKAPPENEPAAE